MEVGTLPVTDQWISIWVFPKLFDPGTFVGQVIYKNSSSRDNTGNRKEKIQRS